MTTIEELKSKIAALEAENRALRDKCESEVYFLKNIISNFPEHVYWMDKDGHMLGCNENQAKDFGLTVDELVGKNVCEIALLTGWEKEAVEVIRKNNLVVVTSGCPKVIEEIGIINGQERVFLANKKPLRDKNNEIMGILGISIDITERKKTEEELKQAKQYIEKANKSSNLYLNSIIAVMPGNVFWQDRNGVYLGCNDNMARILRLPKENIIGRTSWDIVPPAYAKRLMQTDQDIMENNQDSSVEEIGFDESGNPLVYLSKKTPMHDEMGNVIGLLGISVDITEQKKIQEELRLAKEQADVANQAKSEFILNMSHDLRTPFSGILGLSEYLRLQETDLDKKQMLEQVVASANGLLALINEILELANIETGSLGIKAVDFNLKHLIDDTTQLIVAEVKRKHLNFAVSYDEKIPARLLGDKLRISRILLNLFTNALKFTEQGGIQVNVSILHQVVDRVTLCIEVSDTGIGIPHDKQDIIFDRFTRITSTYGSAFKGTGIGLYIVKEFVHDIGGEISVESSPGVGSTFRCAIPLQLAKNTTSEVEPVELVKPPALQPSQLDSITSTNTKFKILLVEDEPIAKIATKVLLEFKLNCEVDIADCGSKALQLATNHYDLILMDIGLPDIDGFTLTKKIRELEVEQPLIVGLTAHVDAKVESKISDFKMNGIISKPITDKTIQYIVDNFLIAQL